MREQDEKRHRGKYDDGFLEDLVLRPRKTMARDRKRALRVGRGLPIGRMKDPQQVEPQGKLNTVTQSAETGS